MKLRIGFLYPYSGIFTKLKNDFRTGFELAVKKELPSLEIENVAEYIHLGDQTQVDKSINKLITFDEVDLIIGIVGTRVILNAKEIYEKYKVPVIINNLGALIPTYSFRSEYLFYNSLALWKSEWVMGKWAQKQFGGIPAASVSIYEAGYNLHEPFRLGTARSGAPIMKLDVTRMVKGDVPDTFPLIESLMLNAPNHVHVLLSGKESAQFLNYYKENGLLNNIPVSANPFMVEECLGIENKSAANIYSASTWSYLLETNANRQFVADYENEYARNPNAFSVLAFETGLILCEALKAMGEKRVSGPEIAKQLALAASEGPRGKINIATTPVASGQQVYVRRSFYDHKEGIIKNEVIDSDPGISWEEPEILNSAYQNGSGWENPYLCV